LSGIGVLAWGAISALGEGQAATSAGSAGEVARVALARDAELVASGLTRPFAGRVPLPEQGDRATVLLEKALAQCAKQLDGVRPAWRRERVGLLLGTSSGGMRAAEAAFAAMARGGSVQDVEAPTYFGPMARASRILGMGVDPAMLVLGACASSAIAIGLALRWLERGNCDVALAGGFDDVTVFVAAGFEALRATTASPPPKPFRIGRDGMTLGEGAAVLALARCASGAIAFISGFGAASDAVHLTAPDRDGAALARAASAALAEAGDPEVDLVSAHATATPFNDAAEARAITRALGPRSRDVVVHPFKAQAGHTLGAASALELLVCIDAMTRGIMPAAAGDGERDPEAWAGRLLERAEAGAPRTALKLASAFGGANAALVVSARPGALRRAKGAAFVHAAVHVERQPRPEDLAVATRMTVDRIARADDLARLSLAAIARLEAVSGPLRGAGLVVGSAFATIETNALFAARIRERGARSAEPRRFPYTSPNAAAGECSIAFGLTGPGFSVGGGLHAGIEALGAGALLVEAGDSERVVVVAVDDAGPATKALAGDFVRTGAVAVLLAANPAGARARVGDISLSRGRAVLGPVRPGHLSILPLVADLGACDLACASPPDFLATIRLEAV